MRSAERCGRARGIRGRRTNARLGEMKEIIGKSCHACERNRGLTFDQKGSRLLELLSSTDNKHLNLPVGRSLLKPDQTTWQTQLHRSARDSGQPR
jgi:hypothetical protein